MILVSCVFGEYLYPRYLMDCRTKRAVEFMDKSQRLLTVTDDDIDWRSLECVEDEDAIDVARYHLFIYPGDISRYENGMAEVRWEINPDGRFYCDEDGFGMTGDVERNLYGVIDRKGKVVKKVTHPRYSFTLNKSTPPTTNKTLTQIQQYSTNSQPVGSP